MERWAVVIRDRKLRFSPALLTICQLPGAAKKPGRRSGGSPQSARRSQEGAEMSEWQRIGEVPVDSGRLVLIDPMNTDDVAEHEGDSALTYELVSNDLGIAVA
jgi:hypothetical protein